MSPATFSQRNQCGFVNFAVTLNLLSPELISSSWPFKQMAIVSVPETAMNKDRSAVLRQNQVWSARQAAVVKKIAKAASVQASPDN